MKPKSRYYAWLLVTLQVATSLYLTFSGPVKPAHWYIAIFPVIGMVLGVWAVLEMRRSRLSLMPDISKGASLVTSGPYRLIRHPMYTSLLLVFIPLVVNQGSLLRILALLLLISSLILKMEYEEKQLVKTFPGYRPYMVKSWRILPGIF
jgi:protein-S-isoprenylcysteine O-methyltransferase Ste14